MHFDMHKISHALQLGCYVSMPKTITYIPNVKIKIKITRNQNAREKSSHPSAYINSNGILYYSFHHCQVLPSRVPLQGWAAPYMLLPLALHVQTVAASDG